MDRDNPQTTDNHEHAKEWIRLEAAMRELRGLEDALLCHKCQGWGVTVYGSTATWYGGVGGQTMTQDVCNKCWGSGNADRPWPSHRLLERNSPMTDPRTTLDYSEPSEFVREGCWWYDELSGFWGDGSYRVSLDTRRAAKTALKVLTRMDEALRAIADGEGDAQVIASQTLEAIRNG